MSYSIYGPKPANLDRAASLGWPNLRNNFAANGRTFKDIANAAIAQKVITRPGTYFIASNTGGGGLVEAAEGGLVAKDL